MSADFYASGSAGSVESAVGNEAGAAPSGSVRVPSTQPAEPAAPRYHVYWGHQHSLSRSFQTFDAALHEYKLHAREHRDRVVTGRDSTAPRLLGAGYDSESDGLRDEEREAVEAVS